MDDEILIESVRQHVELYNVYDERYNNAVHRQRAWDDISQQLGHSAIICKTRWSNIRSSYRKSLKRRMLRSGLTGHQKYKYENELTFLLPFIFISERDFNFSNLIREGDEMSTLTRGGDSRDLQTNLALDLITKTEETEDKMDKSMPRDGQSGREVVVEDETGSIVSESIEPNSSAESDDPRFQARSVSRSVDVFLASVASILKTLSPYYLNFVKSKIFAIAQEAEMIQIVHQEQNRYLQSRKRRAESPLDDSDRCKRTSGSVSPQP